MKIPKGWRVLRRGAKIRKGDKVDIGTSENPWWHLTYFPGDLVRDGTYIRRKRKAAK